MNRPSFKNTTLAITVVIGAIALNNFIFENPIQKGFNRVFSGLGSWLVGQSGSVKIIRDGWMNASSLTGENLRLKEENSLLKSELAGNDILEKENQFLRRQLGVNPRLGRKLLLAKIFVVYRTPISSTLVINRGKKDGIQEGAPVITAGNILVGLVKQVLDNYSVVWLTDDPRLAVDVMVQGVNTLGRTRGLANGNFSIDLLSYTEEVEVWAAVLTAGLGGISEGLLIGEISSIGDGSGDLFRNVRAKSFFEITSGASVFIVTNHD